MCDVHLINNPTPLKALKDNPTQSSELLTKSSSTSPKSFLEDTNTFHNSLPEFENFYFDLEEISSGSTTTHSDISLSEYDSFTFDLSNDQFPPTDRSDFANEEFADELAHIISPPEYDSFYFWNLPDPGELMSVLNSGIHEDLSTTSVNLPVEDDYSPLLAYVAKDHFEIVTKSNDDISSSDDDSLYNENIEYVKASPYDSELVSLEWIVILEVEEIEDDNLREKLLNVHLLIANIEALKDNHTLSSKLLTKSSSTSPKSFLEETNTFHNSLSEFENFCFDLEEISSGSTTTHSNISLSEYDSFIFDLSNDQCPPSDRSDLTHEEFIDELTHIICPPEYDCF
nr:hypothetical protein [Tanacetum cinerariifolium]